MSYPGLVFFRELGSISHFLHSVVCRKTNSQGNLRKKEAQTLFSSHLRIHRPEAFDSCQYFVVLVIKELVDIVMSQLTKKVLHSYVISLGDADVAF